MDPDMSFITSSRRAFLAALGGASSSLLSPRASQACWFSHRHRCRVIPCPPGPPPSPTPPSPATLRVRRNIAQIGPRIESLKAGVAHMKSLPASDPRSWSFQAAIHGTLEQTSNPLFNQCKHSDRDGVTNLFFPWHRGYLYYFERILRWASGDPSLDLPYWDWSTSPGLPEPYRVPASASNPLYEERRAMNDASVHVKEVVITALQRNLELTDFFDPLGVGFSPGIEGSPHGAVHDQVGGPDGVMSQVPTAANDPIFWLHHGNIDRLWDYWLNLGEGRSNLADPEYLDTEFSYADESGSTVTHRVRDILDSARLGYRYDNVANPAPTLLAAADAPARPARRAMAPMGLGPAMIAGEPQVVTPPALAASAPADQQAAPRALGLTTETIRLNHAGPARAQAAPTPRAAPAAGAKPPRLILKIEDIAFDATPGFVYGVYLNVPEGQEPSERTQDNLVGTLNFFAKTGAHGSNGHGQPGERGGTFAQAFDITNVAARLEQKGQWAGPNDARVSLRALRTAPPKGEEMAAFQKAQAASARSNVRVGRIQIFATTGK